jgi:hypothetical protein
MHCKVTTSIATKQSLMITGTRPTQSNAAHPSTLVLYNSLTLLTPSGVTYRSSLHNNSNLTVLPAFPLMGRCSVCAVHWQDSSRSVCLASILLLINPTHDDAFSEVAEFHPLRYKHGVQIWHVPLQVAQSLLLVRHDELFIKILGKSVYERYHRYAVIPNMVLGAEVAPLRSR